MRNKLRIIVTVLFACICIDQGFAQPTVRRLMELPPFERAVLIIKHYETLHRPKHWPTIGYGHVVQPGEPYKKCVRLTERQADALLRKDLRKFCALYRSYGADSLLLACLSYNCGPYRILGNGRDVPKSRLLCKLKSRNRNILMEYLSYSKWRGEKIESIKRRRMTEYLLLYDNRVTRQLYTGSKLFPNEWDATESKIVIPSDCNAGRNGYLSSLREELEAGVSRLSGIIARLLSPCLFSFLAYFKCYLVSHTKVQKITHIQ